MANSRLEELRRRAQERIDQVRESLERGEGVPDHPYAPTPAPPAPTPMRRAPAPPPPESLEGPSLEGPSLETLPPPAPSPVDAAAPSVRPSRPRAEGQPSAGSAPAPAASERGPRTPAGAHHLGPSPAARILSRDTLRTAIIAQEILGKPVSLRPPREVEDL